MKIEMSTLAYIGILIILMVGIIAGVILLGVVGYVAFANPFMPPELDPSEIAAEEGAKFVDTTSYTGAITGNSAAEPEDSITPVDSGGSESTVTGCSSPTGSTGDKVCDGASVEECSEGIWAIKETCGSGFECTAGACVATSGCQFPDGDHDSTMCSSKDVSHTLLQYVWTCNNGNWVYTNDCGNPADCVSGVCQ